ncbi:unnamed protein product [Cochlearia groenlandica]
MDPSLSVSNDPHHPPPFTSFTPFTSSNPYGAPPHPFFAGGAAVPPPNNNNQFFHAPSQQPPIPPNPSSYNHPPYSDMICTAIAALNEPEGSSKQAISRYIERIYTGIPPAHGALLTHHLKTLKSSGVLMMVKKSYKFAVTAPPASVAVAAAAQAAGLEPPRSDYMVNENQLLHDPTVAPSAQKRGRGRPPKAKFNAQSNGSATWEHHNQVPVFQPEVVIQMQQPQTQTQTLIPFRRPPGRPRKDGALPRVKATVSSGVVGIAKRRGRPPSVRAAGRERKPTVVSASTSVIPYVANGGVRRRGRPRRVDMVASSVAPPANVESGGGDEVAGAVVAKRGRGRPSRIGGVIRKPMKPRGAYVRTGKPVGRPRKNAARKGVSGQQDIGYGELKKKLESFQEKAKDIVNVLRAEIGESENQAVVQALQNLEELTITTTTETTTTTTETTTTITTTTTETAPTETTEEPQPQPQPQNIEEMETDEQHTEPEQEQAQAQEQGQAQTEAEAMQEALF